MLNGLQYHRVFSFRRFSAFDYGASAVEKNDVVYYGTGERAWSVLSTNGNGGTYSDGTNSVDSSSALFLLSNTAWYQTVFNNSENNTYTGSLLQSSLLSDVYC